MKNELRDALLNLLLPLFLILGLVLLLSLNKGQNNPSAATVSPLEGCLKVIGGYLAAGTFSSHCDWQGECARPLELYLPTLLSSAAF